MIPLSSIFIWGGLIIFVAFSFINQPLFIQLIFQIIKNNILEASPLSYSCLQLIQCKYTIFQFQKQILISPFDIAGNLLNTACLKVIILFHQLQSDLLSNFFIIKQAFILLVPQLLHSVTENDIDIPVQLLNRL